MKLEQISLFSDVTLLMHFLCWPDSVDRMHNQKEKELEALTEMLAA
ncbi:hypothetical protein, unlikely [Trypanosoma brucei brucei TREU927]|uniref:Uncharacterized protein n=2 Tax=Trypanosoma brucei TaxID=5691 RepID=Q38FJ6_TRYB2|nr:hypothetical protein, unlikely [Trypanosoma brucei brucei TREU927]EAN76424.1 hypothetical protein, unlikely [Trypanosoma brucei brucei TREU927]RHW70465.1 hypothetical protein DPX39_090010700 [Trypanosoma brucei equiperdum]